MAVIWQIYITETDYDTWYDDADISD